MSISISCCCGKKFMVEDDLAGKQAQCQCGNIFTVPEKSVIPWKNYYKLSWQNTVEKFKKMFSTLSLLKRDLLSYWGFLIGKQTSNIGLQNFVQIQPSCEEFHKLQSLLADTHEIRKAKRVAMDFYKTSKTIGEYCQEQNYIFQKFSEILPAEEQLKSFCTTLAYQNEIGLFLTSASKHLPFFLRFSFLIGTFWMIFSILAGIALSFGLFSLVQPYFSFGQFTLIAIGSVFCLSGVLLLFFMIAGRLRCRSEKKRLRRIWIDNIIHTSNAYIPPEIVYTWLDKIFEKKALARWKFLPAPSLVIPENFEFTADIVFAGDNPSQFGGGAEDEKNEEWFQKLYKSCKESFMDSGTINFCFFYTDHLPLIAPFVTKLTTSLSEMNNCTSQEVIFVVSQSVQTPERLGGILSAFSPFFKQENYPEDKHWKMVCRFFENIKLLLKIYDACSIPSETDEQIQLPPFVQIFDGLSKCLYSLAQKRPVLVILERIDHSDPLTLRFLCNLTRKSRNHRLCFLVSYERENVAKMPIIKETILLLQKQNCWKTPEQESNMYNLPPRMLNKQKEWDALQYYLSQASNTPTLQIVGIQGTSGVGKTFLGTRFLDMCSKQYQLWGLFYSYSRSQFEDTCILHPIKELLVHFKEERAGLDQTTCDKITNLLEYLSMETKQKSPNGMSWGSIEDSISRKAMTLDKSTVSDYEIVLNRQNQLWEEIKYVLCVLASQKPLILFLDDMHLVDNGMMKFLTKLANEAPQAAIFVMFAWDDQHIANGSTGFSEFLTHIRETNNYIEMQLEPAKAEDITGYIAETFKPNLLAETSESPFVKMVLEITQGNQFLFTEFLKLLLSKNILHPFGGFWVLKEEIAMAQLSPELLMEKLLDALELSDRKMLMAVLQDAAIYGDTFPAALINRKAQELSISYDNIQNILQNKLFSYQILVQPSLGREFLEFIHQQYRFSIFHSVPVPQRKEIHKKLMESMKKSAKVSQSRLLYHAEESASWDMVTEYAEVLGKHSLSLFELNTASFMFDKGIAAARALKNPAMLAKYCLLKAKTFPSKQINISLDHIKNAVERRQWSKVAELIPKITKKEKLCEMLLKTIETLGAKEKDTITVLIEHVLNLLSNIESEYLCIHFLERTIATFAYGDPLKLRSFVESSLLIVARIDDIVARTRLYLALQKQLGEMDFDLIRVISEYIPITSGTEKALSIYYIASFLQKNPGLVDTLSEEAEEVIDRVRHIMAIRGIAEHVMKFAPEKSIEMLKKIPEKLKDISSHVRRMEAMNSFISGINGIIQQKSFEEMISKFPEDPKLAMIRSLSEVIQETPDVAGRLECLNSLSVIIAKVAKGETLEKMLETFMLELKKLSDPMDRSKGLLKIALGIIHEDVNLAYRYLEEGLNEIQSLDDKSNQGSIVALLEEIFHILDKFPQPLSYPLWDKIIEIASQTDQETRDHLFSKIVPALFLLDQDKSIEVALKIVTHTYRCKTVQALLSLPSNVANIETIEKVLMEKTSDMYGGVLIQELAQRDLGRARRLLRSLPDSLDNKIATIQLCRPSGQRVHEILDLFKGKDDDEDSTAKLFSALNATLARKEYDADGNYAILEMVSDEHPEKIELLMRVVVATQEVDTKLACEAFARTPMLIEKHLAQNQEMTKLQKHFEVLEPLFQELQPSFVETYIEKLLPAVDIISNLPLRILFIKNLCQKLKEVSPDTFLEVVEKMPSDLRFKILEGMVDEYDITAIPNEPVEQDTDSNSIECLASLSLIEQKSPLLGQPVRQILKENIISKRDPLRRMEAWISVLEATAGWDEQFSSFVLEKIFECTPKIPKQEMAPYIKLIKTIYGLPPTLRNDFVMKVIAHLTAPMNGPVLYLDEKKTQLYNAIRILTTLIPFGPSCCHSFVQRLMAVPRQEFDFAKWIQCITEFLTLIRGLVPEKECEWIVEAIGYLDTFSEEEVPSEQQEDIFLLRALSMVSLSKDLIFYRQEQALRSAQRVLQLTEYSSKRYRLHRYIILQLFFLLDYMHAEIHENDPEALIPIKIMRIQCAYYHLQSLKELSPKEKKQFLQEEKNCIKEILNYLISYLKGTLPHQDMAELEEALVMAHEQLKEEMENAFQKILVAKPGQGLTQAFFLLTQALCLLDNDTLQSWPIPWMHRMIRVASRIDPMTLSVAGDDFLKADEREEFSVFIQRVSLIFPRTVLLLIHSMFSRESISEIPSELEDEVISPEIIKQYILPLTNPSLQRYRDRLLANLCLEWIEYNWKEGFLLASHISDQEVQARAVSKLLRKSFDYYPDEQSAVCNKAYLMLQKLKNSRAKVFALIEVAIRIAATDAGKALDIAVSIDPMERRVEILERITYAFDWDQGFYFVNQIPLPKFRAVCIHAMLCKLPSEIENRMACIQKIWELTQTVREDSLRVELMKDIVRIAIRAQDIAKDPGKISNLLLEMWESASKFSSSMALDVITTTFPIFLKMLDENSVESLFQNLYSPQHLSVNISQGNYNTIVL